MPRKTQKQTAPPHDAQVKLEARLSRVLVAVYDGKVKRDGQRLPGLTDTESQIWWSGFGLGREHLAHVLESICNTIGDATFAPGLRPGEHLPWEKADAASAV